MFAAGGPWPEINVTPFVDVMLVLLIVFMVTAPLLTVGVPVDLPETRAKSLGQDRGSRWRCSIDKVPGTYFCRTRRLATTNWCRS